MSSENPTPDLPSSDEQAVKDDAAWRRKRRLDAVFGDDLPEIVTDPGENPHAGRPRSWYEDNTPPHHG
ncbi:MAG: hypothetical protein WBA98_01355 [Gordonia sp. (in: high G+C Gram-positive bacteria)]|uniref:hypothetical protein n=1 Tax=Gordonia sp. (in: high G+C Gram-positive bacteria) TaxID=84139 RepID=UPI003C75ADFE